MEMRLREAGETLTLQRDGLGTGQRDAHQLTLCIQMPATPERVDTAIAIDRVAIQTQTLQAMQFVEHILR